jgi:hypothetical protein
MRATPGRPAPVALLHSLPRSTVTADAAGSEYRCTLT